MSKKKIIILSLVAIVVIIAAIVFWYEFTRPKYKIVDSFADNSPRGKAVFVFVKVNSYNESFLRHVGKEIRKGNRDLNDGNPELLKLLMVYFYIDELVAAPKEKALKKLMEMYPKRKDLEEKLNYIDSAYTYSWISHKVPGVKVPSDSLFKAPVFVPKKGIKAKEVLLKKKQLLAPELNNSIPQNIQDENDRPEKRHTDSTR